MEANPLMAASEPLSFKEHHEMLENYTESEGSDLVYDSDFDSGCSILEDTHAKLSNLSITKRSKSCIGDDMDIGVDENEEGIVQKIIEAGQLEKLKVEQCKIYLRKNGLRLTGNKCTLIQRIKEHQEISNGEGEKKYPVSSFVLNCKGDACMGDVIMFEQNVYEMFNLASHSATGPPCGKRIVAGRIVKESYGAAKQQHTFTIEVLWSEGEKPLPPLHQLLIKGRNLYRLKTLRQRWEDEAERLKILMEKHLRGSLARSDRETRIQEKEKRKIHKPNRMSIKKDPKRIQSLNLEATEKEGIVFQQPDLSVDTDKMAIRSQQPEVQPQQSGLNLDKRNVAVVQRQAFIGSRNLAVRPRFPLNSGNLSSQSQDWKVEMQNNDQKQLAQDPFKRVVIKEMQHPLDDIIFHAERTNHRRPNLDTSGHQSLAYKYTNTNSNCTQPNFSRCQSPSYKNAKTNQMNGLPQRTSHRPPFKSINHFRPISPPHRRGYMKPQLCRYYTQGGCHFGDNCKFLHERR